MIAITTSSSISVKPRRRGGRERRESMGKGASARVSGRNWGGRRGGERGTRGPARTTDELPGGAVGGRSRRRKRGRVASDPRRPPGVPRPEQDRPLTGRNGRGDRRQRFADVRHGGRGDRQRALGQQFAEATVVPVALIVTVAAGFARRSLFVVAGGRAVVMTVVMPARGLRRDGGAIVPGLFFSGVPVRVCGVVVAGVVVPGGDGDEHRQVRRQPQQGGHGTTPTLQPDFPRPGGGGGAGGGHGAKFTAESGGDDTPTPVSARAWEPPGPGSSRPPPPPMPHAAAGRGAPTSQRTA